MTLAETIQALRAPLLADGRIDMAETAVLLRAVAPFSRKGDPNAITLEKTLRKVREDGVVTKEESDLVLGLLARLSDKRLALAEYVREIPDFPKPGVLFRDVTGVFDTSRGFRLALDLIAEELSDVDFDLVVAPESRGFIFGAAIAAKFGKAFVPVRKPGKLPRETISETYELEYGQATLHMHADAVIPGERAVVVDDLLATGGTAAAVAKLVERLGGTVAKMLFPIELEGFRARENALKGYQVSTLVRYPGK